MKLAAIYNVFDGEENLQNSINSIRDNVDLIIVIYQKISNFGIKHKKNIEEILKKIQFINIIQEYDTNFYKLPWENEINKRVMGCKIALENKCTHFLYMDCDENYDFQNFKEAKKQIENNVYDSSACEIVDYYKFKNLIIEDSISYVPFIHELKKGITRFSLNLGYPVLVDNTRKCGPTENFKLFKKEEIVMNHYSWIRDDIEQKLINWTGRHSFLNFINLILEEYNNFKITDKLVRLETGLLVPESLTKKIILPYNFKPVNTRII